MENKKANLFLVGAMKAGTTSFMELLGQHPKIYISPIKEPHFFVKSLPEQLYAPSAFFSIESYFKKHFPKHLHIGHVTQSSDYKKLFSLAKEEEYLLEGSTMYLHAPEVASKISDYNPNAKIIILLRDPLERAFSHYKMLVGLSREVRSFEKVMVEDIQAYHNNKLAWHSCLAMSFYKTPIDNFKKHFENVYLIKFEEVTTYSLESLNTLFLKLNLAPLQKLNAINTNPTRNLRFKWMLYFLKNIGVKDYFSAIFNSKIKKKIFHFLSSSKKESMNLRPDTLKALHEIFEKESVL